MIEYRYTGHQTARAARPDEISAGVWALIKNVSLLRLTYQIRLITLLAEQRGASLVIRVPPHCRLSSALAAFLEEHKDRVRIEKAI